MQVCGLARYPIKSCRGVSVEAAQVHPWGLVGDRRWMLVDVHGEVVTAREYPQLVLVEVELIDGPRTADEASCLRLRAPGRPELVVAEPPVDRRIAASVWRNPVPATPAASSAHRWFSELLGIEVRLVFLDDPTSRRINKPGADPGDVVSFADAYPLLLTNAASLAAVNDLILTGRWRAEAPLPMTRFRPNVTVQAPAAWAEDEWRRIRIGEVTFRVAGKCGRCVLTTVDPDTGVRGKEPLATLARHRNWDGKMWFGMNLIPELRDGQLATPPHLRLGDSVEVLA